MTRVITICSGKGGTGKTTLVANLGIALAKRGKDVVILDANITTPNLGIHLGVPLFPVTIHDVLKGTARISDATYEHESGLKIIPAGISLRDLQGIDSRDLPNTLLDLIGNTDIIILDAAAGLGREALSAIESSDELIIITNPTLPSVTDALKAIKLAERLGTRIGGVVINRVTGRKYEMSTKEILDMLGDVEVLAEVPEDQEIQKALYNRTPVISFSPRSKASREIYNLASRITGEKVYAERPWYRKLFR